MEFLNYENTPSEFASFSIGYPIENGEILCPCPSILQFSRYPEVDVRSRTDEKEKK